jgi:hypothetical protein
MRRTVFGLAAAAVLVLAACGGDDDDSSGGDNGGSETNEAAGGEPSSPEAARFCDDFMELTQQGPAGASPDALVEAMRELQPPEEIADDFALTIEGTELQAQMAAGGAEPDPALQEQFRQREQEYQDANMNIQEFLSTECQIGSPPPSDASDDSGDSGESGG